MMDVYSKADNVDFLSEMQYLGLKCPGPSSYTPNVSQSITLSNMIL